MNIDEKLPDLVTSSPKHSRQSSPSSSEVYRSVEALTTDFPGKEVAEDVLCQLENLENNFDKERNLKLSIKNSDEVVCPIVTITSPSPTNETPARQPSIEATKLTIPKEAPNRPTETGNSSFDDLKRDLRQRKAKNKLAMGELRPLSAENAQRKISDYFVQKNEKPGTKAKEKRDPTPEKKPDVQIVELDVRPKLSSKVEAKDLMKYFSKVGPPTSSVDGDPSITFETSIDALNAIDPVDIDIGDLFDQIERESEDANLFGDGDAGYKAGSGLFPVLQVRNENTNGLNTSEEGEPPKTIIADVPEDPTSLMEDLNAESSLEKLQEPETNGEIKVRQPGGETSAGLRPSDGQLNLKQGIVNEIDKSVEISFRNSKSLSDLANLPAACVAVPKVVEESEPVRVDEINSTVVEELSGELPRRPERKHGPQPFSEFIPEIPTRKKPAKRKPNAGSSADPSNAVENSSATPERLTATGASSDKQDGSRDSLDSASKMDSVLSQPVNRVANKSESKNLAAKSDRLKKDKCVVS